MRMNCKRLRSACAAEVVISFRRWNVNPVGSHKFRIGYFGAKLDALHSRLLDRLGQEGKEVLVKQSAAQIIQIRGERHGSLRTQIIRLASRFV